jgi:hypothetical protein
MRFSGRVFEFLGVTLIGEKKEFSLKIAFGLKFLPEKSIFAPSGMLATNYWLTPDERSQSKFDVKPQSISKKVSRKASTPAANEQPPSFLRSVLYRLGQTTGQWKFSTSSSSAADWSYCE